MTAEYFDDFETQQQCEELFDTEPDDSMDGDSESALASAGFGTDESYHNDSYNDTPFGIELDGGSEF